MMRPAASVLLPFGLAVGLYCQVDQNELSAKTLDELRQTGKQVTAPKVLAQVEPDYSEKLRKKRIAGTVVIYCVVDEKGIPQALKVKTSSNHVLDKNALDAVRQWRFEPAMVDGVPTPVIASVGVTFNLY